MDGNGVDHLLSIGMSADDGAFQHIEVDRLILDVVRHKAQAKVNDDLHQH